MGIMIWFHLGPTIRKEERATTRTLLVGKTLSDNAHWRNDGRGFTLLELILVLVLIGMIAGLTTPFVMTTLERIDRQSAVRKLVTTLRFTRSQAITTKLRFAFVADIDGNQYWVSNLKTREKSKFRKLEQEIKISEFSDNKNVINKGTFYIVFYPQGNSSGGSILMDANDPGDSREWFQISVDPVTGKPSVSKGEG